jgi:hypothetical protein
MRARSHEDEDTPRAPVRRMLVIENQGYPLTTWLAVHFLERDDTSTVITTIDIYADEQCRHLLVDGLDLPNFDAEQRENIHHALHVRICTEADKAAFARQIERIQAALIDTVARVSA